MSTLKLAVFISGTGSNFKAIHASLAQYDSVEICCVVSNSPDAKGLSYASEHKVPCICLDHKTFDSREAHEHAIIEALQDYQPDLIILAGYMRVLTEAFISQFEQRMVNIHPSLLPMYKGLNTHQRVLEDFKQGSQTQHGCSVHWVTAGVDEGDVIAQATTDITKQDTPQSLQLRVHALEHKLYPIIIHSLSQSFLSQQSKNSETIGYNKTDAPIELSIAQPLLFNESQLIETFNEIFSHS